MGTLLNGIEPPAAGTAVRHHCLDHATRDHTGETGYNAPMQCSAYLRSTRCFIVARGSLHALPAFSSQTLGTNSSTDAGPELREQATAAPVAQ